MLLLAAKFGIDIVSFGAAVPRTEIFSAQYFLSEHCKLVYNAPKDIVTTVFIYFHTFKRPYSILSNTRNHFANLKPVHYAISSSQEALLSDGSDISVTPLAICFEEINQDDDDAPSESEVAVSNADPFPRRLPSKIGGTAWLKPLRNVKPKVDEADKLRRAKTRAISKLGQSEFDRIASGWANLRTLKRKTPLYEKGNGVILNLIDLGLSNIEIRSILPIGCGRISQLRKFDGSNATTRRRPAHALSDESIAYLNDVIKSWPVEDGFPCAHRRPVLYLLEEGITYKKLYDRYEKAFNELVKKPLNVSIMAYSTFTTYVHYMCPGLRLSRAQQDLCDACFRLDVILKDPSSTAEEKSMAELESTQRRAISAFTKKWIGNLNPSAPIPETILKDYIDDDDLTDPIELDGRNGVLILVEDYGSGIPIPHYGFRRPGSDYYQSNLMVHMYVIADVSRNEHNVVLYDERLMGKDKDALCSLRMTFQLQHHQRCIKSNRSVPKLQVKFRDNCVGQIKSNIVLKFEVFISMLFDIRTLLLFFIPGRWMTADIFILIEVFI